MKLIIGLVLAVFVGIGCRWFGIPLPGPPAIMGAAMAVAMATGYTATDYWLTKRSSPPNQSITTPAASPAANTAPNSVAIASINPNAGNGTT